MIDDSARGTWLGDSVRVRQILYNLISNALKFTGQGGVEVAIAGVRSDGSSALGIRVEDTGIGIASDKLDALFDKFVQADATTTRRFGGTGLGLSICKELVELMGGTIKVQSEEGSGTAFDVLLPLEWLSTSVDDARTAAADAEPETAGAALAQLRILAAEDNATNRIVLKTILNAIGLDPEIVDNGREAVDAWRAGQFDLILMDVQMPVLDGVSATGEIRRVEAREGLERTPIVALSANAMTHQVREYLEAGMDAHLAKPIEMQKLYAVLKGFAVEGPGAASRAAA